MLTPFRAVVAALVVLPAAAFGQAILDEPIKTTLCDVVAHPERFDRKVIQLRTYVVNTIDVPPGLYEHRCPPNNLLHVERNNSALIGSKGYKDLRMSLSPSTPVEATVTGIFVNKKVRPDLNTFDSTFELLSITDVAVKTAKEVFQPADRPSRKK